MDNPKRKNKMMINSDQQQYQKQQLPIPSPINQSIPIQINNKTQAQTSKQPTDKYFSLFNMKQTKKQQPNTNKSTKKIENTQITNVNLLPTNQKSSENLFSKLTLVYEKVANSKGQNSKNAQKNYLSNLFKQICLNHPQDLVKTYWLSVLKIGPDYQKNELGVGKQILTKAVAKSCGKSEKQIRDAFQNIGDLGQVAATSKATQKTMDTYFTKKKQNPSLSIDHVFKTFFKISRLKGNSSVVEKQNEIMKLLLASKNQETKYIVRWIEGNLKISAGQKTMQSALIKALFQLNYRKQNQTEENQQKYEKYIKRAMSEYPNEEIIIKKLIQIKENIEQLPLFCKITPGIPCKPMLAKPQKQISSILTRFQNKKFTCQFKYDGLRGQIHYENNRVQIFSRNLENLTEAYPDIVVNIQSNLKGAEIDSFIIDSQIVAINPKTKQILPFQILSTRARKNTNINDIQVTISVFAFDILYLNEPLTHLTLSQRRKYLNQIQSIFPSIISVISYKQCQQITQIDQFLQVAIKEGTQGLMIKDLNAPYSCAKRSWDWVKLKKDYIDGLGDTLDVVPIGGNYGQGKRKGLYGAYLLAVYNSDLQIYETICKIGTGFSDQVLEAAFKYFSDKTLPNCPSQYYKVSNCNEADVWFTPSTVWQIKGADFQLSPIYTCGKGNVDPNRGIGLRFPRLIKIRQDKKPFQSSNSEFVIDLYNQQAVVQNKNQKQEDEDDYY